MPLKLLYSRFSEGNLLHIMAHWRALTSDANCSFLPNLPTRGFTFHPVVFSPRDGIDSMATLTIRRLDEKTKTRLRVRAAHHGRSMEEEAREILHSALTTASLGPPAGECCQTESE